MKRSFWTVILVGAILLAGSSWRVGRAAPPPPGTADLPPEPPHVVPEDVLEPQPSEQVLSLAPLKAVLVVGPIDGADGPTTIREKANMDLAAAELEALGVAVFEFYAPEDRWDQIRAAAEGAHLFLYRGHGVYWNSAPEPEVGGLALTEGLISPDDLRNGLHLAPNAIVMLYGCFTAGSSALDEGEITSQEAQRRVAQYSDPFLDIGAAVYYANWFGDAFQVFVRHLFQGLTLGQAYETFYGSGGATIERFLHPDHPDLAMWLDKDDWQGHWQYHNAFVGIPEQTLLDLFPAPQLAVAPPAISYLAGPDAAPRVVALTIASTGSASFHWTAEVTPGVPWLGLSPQDGSSGQATTAAIDPSGQELGVHQAAIQIIVDDPDLGGRNQTIPVTLRRVAQVHAAYLPFVVGRSP